MTIQQFIEKFNNATTGLFRAGQNRGIGSDDMRELVEDIANSFAGRGGASELVVSSALTGTLSTSTGVEIFTGADNGTRTFPPIAGNTGITKTIKNKTSAFNLTLDSSGSDEIWDFEEADSRVIGPGESRTYINDGTHWTQI